MHYPAGTDSKICGLEHHVSCNNAGIDVTAELSIIRTSPAFILVIADYKNERCIKMAASTFLDLRKTFSTLNYNDSLSRREVSEWIGRKS